MRQALRFALLLFICSTRCCFAQDATDAPQVGPETVKHDSTAPEDISKRLGLFLAFEGGSGWTPGQSSTPAAYGGIKLGGNALMVDFGYDRAQGHHGFSGEGAGMFSVFRFPGPQKNSKKNYLRVFAEPGLGLRAGGGITTYASAKVMVILLSDYRLTTTGTKWSPFIEAQRRFPFGNPLQGDNRLSIGLMFAICEHCGLD